ncbi:hypothetical protein BC831DRAFT_550147 [Entophlyctis helioformis]|nr:hypothetical protein BC831DRAFT_550147 [Entophlyctis helioformis]
MHMDDALFESLLADVVAKGPLALLAQTPTTGTAADTAGTRPDTTADTTDTSLELLARWHSAHDVTGVAFVAGAVTVSDNAGRLTALGLDRPAGTQPSTQSTTQPLTLAVDQQHIDTKGSCVAALAAGNLAPHTPMDLVAGDASGTVAVVLGGEQIFTRKDMGSPISCVAVQPLPDRLARIVVGDTFGAVTTLDMMGAVAWKARLAHITLPQPPDADACRIIRAVHPVAIRDAGGAVSHYIAVCDGRRALHLVAEGSCHASIPLPSQIQCIASGQFLPLPLPSAAGQPADPLGGGTVDQDIAVGGLDGRIYIVSTAGLQDPEQRTFQVISYANVGFAVTRLARFRPSWLASSASTPDWLLCAAQIGKLHVYSGGALLHAVDTGAWVWTLDVAAADDRIALGLLDRSVQVWQASSAPSLAPAAQ